MSRTRTDILNEIRETKKHYEELAVEIGQLNGKKQVNPADNTIFREISIKNDEQQQALLDIKSLEKELRDLNS